MLSIVDSKHNVIFTKIQFVWYVTTKSPRSPMWRNSTNRFAAHRAQMPQLVYLNTSREITTRCTSEVPS